MSIYDMLIQKGMKKGMEKEATRIIQNIMKFEPSLTNKQIAHMTKEPLTFIKKVRDSNSQN